MKILFINTSEHIGGASIAANRLMSALQKGNMEVFILVRDKDTDNPTVASINQSWLNQKVNYLRFVWERLVIFFYNKFNRENLFRVSIANTGTDISRHPLVKEADVIHLHWINQGFLSLADIEKLIKLGKPVVWTMHDMWPCTGICHYAGNCSNFTNKCGYCPFLKSTRNNDLSNKAWKKKNFIISSSIQIVTVSSWLANIAKQSSLTRKLAIETIPNVIDASILFKKDKGVMRESLSLPSDKNIILMGAARLDDPIKGLNYLVNALSLLIDGEYKKENLLLVLFGEIKNKEVLKDLSIPYISLGLIKDINLIANLYSAADVTVVPSLYETFGQTIIEAMACGCPTVSFDNSGQTDIIDHKVNGYLAAYRNTKDFADGIHWALHNKNNPKIANACLKKVQDNYTESIVAGKYISLYKKLLES
ncbi:GDP-mannose-dependent alpha-(1-6)-phosphatidylinositol dimannoside mannosyltransferase [Bacteroidales bacterium Barb6]|nr:GDP-mannose-dependent alpha-(1-6)-phosphatidylinositol dimannoside mannosyltransferase [Bacteroidales bacterium Barb6]